MTYQLEVKVPAIKQAAQIYAYYERKLPGLGERFIAALTVGYDALRSRPFYQVRKAPYRYLKLRKFPYRLIYEVHDNTVVIYQVRYTGRKSSRKFGT